MFVQKCIMLVKCIDVTFQFSFLWFVSIAAVYSAVFQDES